MNPYREMDKKFTGEEADSKKGAEHAAATAALEALSDQIATVEEEHKAKENFHPYAEL